MPAEEGAWEKGTQRYCGNRLPPGVDQWPIPFETTSHIPDEKFAALDRVAQQVRETQIRQSSNSPLGSCSHDAFDSELEELEAAELPISSAELPSQREEELESQSD